MSRYIQTGSTFWHLPWDANLAFLKDFHLQNAFWPGGLNRPMGIENKSLRLLQNHGLLWIELVLRASGY